MTGWHTGKVGTEMYMSPEMITFKGKGRVEYSFKTDIWGVGMVFAELMCLDYAFDVSSTLERINAIAKGTHYRKLPEMYPEIVWNMTKSMLQVDYWLRPTAEEAVLDFERYFIQNEITLEKIGINIPGFKMFSSWIEDGWEESKDNDGQIFDPDDF